MNPKDRMKDKSKVKKVKYKNKSPQETAPEDFQIIMTREARIVTYSNYSRLFYTESEFLLDLGQQLPPEEGRRKIIIKSRTAMTPQMAERLGNLLTNLVAEYKKGREKQNKRDNTTKEEREDAKRD
ncbi:MAG: DUF3467 domain-containing protein [Candidatus Heimdallarchaeota archaeon]